MKRILLDENVPIGLVELLGVGNVQHVHAAGWSGLSDASLIERAIKGGFDVLVTTDQSLVFQQNLRGLTLALVVVDTNNWNVIKAKVPDMRRAIAASRAGDRTEVAISRTPRRMPR